MRYYKFTFLPPVPTTSNPNPQQSPTKELQRVLTPGGSELVTLGNGQQQRVQTWVLESTTPSALQVELNCMLGGGALNIQDLGSNYVKIWGWPPEVIAGIASLNNWTIRVQAGFDANSLPLGKALNALPGSGNTIIEGTINFPYGNAIRPEFVVTLPIARSVVNDQVQAPTGNSAPLFLGKKGERLSDVLNRTFQVYYPGLQTQVVLTDSIVLTENLQHAISSLQDLTNMANTLSKACLRSQYPSYPGAIGRFVGNKFVLTDSIAALGQPSKLINTVDMIGPPQYIDGSSVHVSCPMRADIRCLDVIELKDPNLSLVASVNSSAGITSLGWPQTLVGKFQVLSVQHVGNNRAPDGTGWATHLMINALPIKDSDVGKPFGSQGAQAAAPQTFGNN
ncbi:hypothetical protein [Burkholderia gladioli]|uniref:hypothetical protein n=1 Tax=Burkholderia gladioli TaxID=28095 RepID=UPI003D257071